jgi:hypothetical protein
VHPLHTFLLRLGICTTMTKPDLVSNYPRFGDVNGNNKTLDGVLHSPISSVVVGLSPHLREA